MEYVSARRVEFPALGFGTARMTGETCRSAVRAALAAGYRHVDFDLQGGLVTRLRNRLGL